MSDDERELERRLRAHLEERASRAEVPAGQVPAVTGGRRPARVLLVAAVAGLLVASVTALVTGDRDPSVVAGPTSTTAEPTSTTAAPTSTTAEPARAADEPIVVMGRQGLIGWWDGSQWRGWGRDGVESEDQLPSFPVGETFRVFALDEPVLETAARQGDPCGLGTNAPLDRSVEMVERGTGFATYDPVAINGSHDPRPRPVSPLGPIDRDRFKDQARRVLAELRLEDDDPPIQQAIKADLDGDGAEEYVVVVERAFDRNREYKEGDVFYSVTFVSPGPEASNHELVDASVEKVNLMNPGLTYFIEGTVGALVDTNGDGRMEIAESWTYYEGFGAEVHAQTPTGKWTSVMGYSCGA